MNRILVSLLFISLTQANSLSGVIYSSSGNSPIEGAIILATYSVGVVTGISGPDGDYWIPCEGSVDIEITALGYDTLVTTLEVTGDTVHDFYMDERDNALKVNHNVKISYQLAFRPDHPDPFNTVKTLHHHLPGDARVNITM